MRAIHVSVLRERERKRATHRQRLSSGDRNRQSLVCPRARAENKDSTSEVSVTTDFSDERKIFSVLAFRQPVFVFLVGPCVTEKSVIDTELVIIPPLSLALTLSERLRTPHPLRAVLMFSV